MKKYRVEKKGENIIITPDRNGKYRADTAEEIRGVIENPHFRTLTAEVKLGRRWYPLRPVDKRTFPCVKELARQQ